MIISPFLALLYGIYLTQGGERILLALGIFFFITAFVLIGIHLIDTDG